MEYHALPYPSLTYLQSKVNALYISVSEGLGRRAWTAVQMIGIPVWSLCPCHLRGLGMQLRGTNLFGKLLLMIWALNN